MYMCTYIFIIQLYVCSYISDSTLKNKKRKQNYDCIRVKQYFYCFFKYKQIIKSNKIKNTSNNMK